MVIVRYCMLIIIMIILILYELDICHIVIVILCLLIFALCTGLWKAKCIPCNCGDFPGIFCLGPLDITNAFSK